MQWLATAGNWVLKALWPIVVIVVGWYFVEADRGHKITAEAIDLLGDAAKPDKRIMGVWLVVYEMNERNLFFQNYIPEPVSRGLVEYMQSTDLAPQYAAATSSLVARPATEVEPPKKGERVSEGTVYIQICGKDQTDFANAIKKKLTDYAVPGFENVDKDGTTKLCPNVNQVRYFQTDGAAGAQKIADTLNGDANAVSKFKTSDLTKLGERKDIPATQFEIWLAAGSPAFAAAQ